MQSNEPYIGSVRFFKNIIFLCCILGVLIPTGLALRWRSRAKTAESLLAQNAVVLTGEEDEAASEAEAASEEAEPEADSLDGQEPLSYQMLYPDFYAPTPLPDIEDAGKTIYLTFDDGPSDRTDEVLKILDEKGVKATFFVIGREDETSIQRIKKAAAAGHTIGMHSYSHDYEKIYTSVEDFLDDFYKLFVILRDEAGVTPTVFRFPGGHTPTEQEVKAWYAPLAQKMLMDCPVKEYRYFQHFKGGKYKFFHSAFDSETLERMVVYQALYGQKAYWVRPEKMFFGKVTRDGRTFNRFTEVDM